MITDQHRQEALSRAYVQAVSGAAGVNAHIGSEFDYGFDGQFKPVKIRNNRRVESGFHLDFQLKCTTRWETRGDQIVYDLEAKTYNDLVDRDPAATGAVLILMCVPNDPLERMSFEERQMTLRHCCYWQTFAPGPAISQTTKRVFLPRSNLLTADGLISILENERVRRTGGAV